MKLSKQFLFSTLIGLLWTSAVSAQDARQHDSSEKLGQVNFRVSCSADAQKQFNRATALLHSFGYAEAEKAFSKVTVTDPDCAMGHWGIAMSNYHPLWAPPTPEESKKGAAAVERAKLAGGKTQRERDYIAAIGTFYKGSDKLDHRTRALAYEKAMEQVYRSYPEDREAAIFYALALNSTALPTDKTYPNQKKAVEILNTVSPEVPNHPGVAHYIIHNFDYPELAPLALPAARSYAKIAPASAHALHMPSHIFTRLGLWQESIQTNRASASVAKEHRSVFDQLHAMDYLAYAYLQGAQDREAKRVLDEGKVIEKVKMGLEHFASAYALWAIPARYALERRRWGEAASLEPRQSRYPYTEAMTYFVRAIGSVRSGDFTTARKDVEKLQTLRDELLDAKQNYWADQVEIQHRAAAAWLAYAEGKNEEALQLMRSAAELEDSTEKHPVTPGSIIPAREFLGDLLLELGQPAQALKEYETSLRHSPNRFNGIYGAARAGELSADRKKARTYYAKLVALCDQADGTRPELQKAKAFLRMFSIKKN